MTEDVFEVVRQGNRYRIRGPIFALLTASNKEQAEQIRKALNQAFVAGRERLRFSLLDLLGAAPEDHSHD